MDSSVFIAVISGSGSIVVAAAAFYFTKKHRLKVECRREKLNHYKVLLASISDFAAEGAGREDINKQFALAANTVSLVAPQYVVTALMNFHNEVKFKDKSEKADQYDRALKELLVAIRKDIGFTPGEDIDNFNFHLIGSASK